MKRPLAIRSFLRAFRNTARDVSCYIYFSSSSSQGKWAARSLCNSRLTTVRGHCLGTRSHWVDMEVLTAGIAPNTDARLTVGPWLQTRARRGLPYDYL